MIVRGREFGKSWALKEFAEYINKQSAIVFNESILIKARR